jgi:hypothetical protein
MQKMKHSPVENQVNIWINELNGYFLIIHHDIAEILLKLMLNTNQSINQSINSLLLPVLFITHGIIFKKNLLLLIIVLKYTILYCTKQTVCALLHYFNFCRAFLMMAKYSWILLYIVIKTSCYGKYIITIICRNSLRNYKQN